MRKLKRVARDFYQEATRPNQRITEQTKQTQRRLRVPLRVTTCVVETSQIPRDRSQKPEEESLEKGTQKEAVPSPRGTREPAGPLLRSEKAQGRKGRSPPSTAPTPTDRANATAAAAASQAGQSPRWTRPQRAPELRDAKGNFLSEREKPQQTIILHQERKIGSFAFCSAFFWPNSQCPSAPLCCSGRVPDGTSQNQAQALQAQKAQQ